MRGGAGFVLEDEADFGSFLAIFFNVVFHLNKLLLKLKSF